MISRCPGYEMFCKNFYKFDFSIETFRKYNESVLEFFEDKEDQLLTMNIPEGDGYEKLCPFLGLDKINQKFPNKKEVYLQLYLRLKYILH
jgi:hypothetical protein